MYCRVSCLLLFVFSLLLHGSASYRSNWAQFIQYYSWCLGVVFFGKPGQVWLFHSGRLCLAGFLWLALAGCLRLVLRGRTRLTVWLQCVLSSFSQTPWVNPPALKDSYFVQIHAWNHHGLMRGMFLFAADKALRGLTWLFILWLLSRLLVATASGWLLSTACWLSCLLAGCGGHCRPAGVLLDGSQLDASGWMVMPGCSE